MQTTGKTALITGGNDGLGFAICLALAKKNAHVFLTARNPEKGKEYVFSTRFSLEKGNFSEVSAKGMLLRNVQGYGCHQVLIGNQQCGVHASGCGQL